MSQVMLDLFKKQKLLDNKIKEQVQRVYATAPIPSVQKIELAKLKRLRKQEDVLMAKEKVQWKKETDAWKKEHKGKTRR